MTTSAPPDWSPANNPHAIAISEAQWWQRAVHLAVLRLRDPDDQRISWFSSRQIDARQLVFALRQILNAERLVAGAMEARGVGADAHEALARARQRFEDALPGITDMRNALMHFDEWSRGEGRGPQKGRRDAGGARRDVAREYWGFGYDPNAGAVSLGPYTIGVDTADQAAKELSGAICLAARAVDQANVTELLSRTAGVLDNAGISCASTSAEEASLWLRVKDDSRAWLSLTAAGLTRVITGWPALALLIAVKLLSGMLEHRDTEDRPPIPGPAAVPRADGPSPDGPGSRDRPAPAPTPPVLVPPGPDRSEWRRDEHRPPPRRDTTRPAPATSRDASPRGPGHTVPTATPAQPGTGRPIPSPAQAGTVPSKGDTAVLLPAARAARDELHRDGRAFTRDALATRLRQNGYQVRNSRLTPLLRALRSEQAAHSPG